MKCVRICALFVLIWTANARETSLKQEIAALSEQIELLKTTHSSDVSSLKKEIQELKQNNGAACTDNHERNEQATLDWAKTSMKEIRVEMRELGRSINSSQLLRQLHTIRNELKRALAEARDLAHLARTQEARVDKLDNEVERIKYEQQELRSMTVLMRTGTGKLLKELKTNKLDNVYTSNDVMDQREIEKELKMKHGRRHRIRHSKMVHAQISRLARTQEQLDTYQQNLQTQILDVQRRLDRVEEPNWNLMSEKVDNIEYESKTLRDEIKNVTQKLSDFEKIHASVLELREDIESIENKADRTIPEFRKEISKLDVSVAQLNAQSSYLKEDQENLRQSVKAIAVSISNTIDRAAMDRLAIKEMNETVIELQTRSKKHYSWFNDRILKSEANNSYLLNMVNNETVGMLLPELMGEVKTLQPVEREYEDLVSKLPKDCSEVSGPDGLYLIHPGKSPVETWCSNGSTLLQRRVNGSVEFNRKFSEYVYGFGNASSEFWLGLESMHQLSSDNCSSMRIEMTDIYGSSWFAEYDHFSVGSADTGYILDVSGFFGNASDAFEYQNHMEFSAIDRDRDISNSHCAGNYEGGWWFSHCQHVNINGKYTLGLTWFDSGRNEWIAVASSEMRLRRRLGCV